MENLETRSEEVAHILKCIAHPKRLLILCRLHHGSQTVGELEKYCNISQSQLSQFLILMKDEGILDSEKNGQFVSYHIADDRIRMLVKNLETVFCN